MRAPAKGAPLQVAFGRDVARTGSQAQLHGLLDWETLANGDKVAAVSFTSPGASALRLGLRIVSIPPGATLRFRGSSDPGMFEVSGDEILEAIAANLDAGDQGPDAHTYWSPAVDGETATMEVELPADSTERFQVAVPAVSHFVASTRDTLVEKSSSCELDVMCYQATWDSSSKAVARMFFQVGTSGYLCTGTLVADQDPSSTTPYFLSANHCVSDQTTASTVQTYWNWRSVACNGAADAYTRVAGGATLLYHNGNTDTSFMQLNGTPPAGAMFAGWNVGSPQSLNTPMTGIHHPGGDLQKISFGSLYMYAICTPSGTGSETFSCSTSSSGSATFLGVLWNQGLTEPGSSGSGLFVNNGHYLMGQLYGGSSQCGVSGGPDFYGRFDVAYNAALSQWLTPSTHTLSVARTGIGTGTVTSSPSGISCGATCSASFSQGAAVALTATPSGSSTFTGWSGACSGTGTCNVTMNVNVSVTASFNNPALTPGAPTNLVATPANNQAVLSFVPPTNTGGSAIVQYTATCNPGAITATASATPVVVNGLLNGTTYSCSVTATNASTTGPASSPVSVTPPGPGTILGVVSRKTHNVSQFELAIDTTRTINQAITIEPRIDTTHRIVFKVSVPVSAAGTLTVVDANNNPVAASAASSGNEVVVSSSAVIGRRVLITLTGINGSLNASAAVGFLAGDVSGDGKVTAADVLREKGKVGQFVSLSTFPYDVNLDGLITTTDLGAVQARTGTSLQ